MSETRDFMTGKTDTRIPEIILGSYKRLIGRVIFFSLSNGIEFIGLVEEFREGFLLLKKPHVITRNSPQGTKFSLTSLNQLNPFIRDEISINISQIVFYFTPPEELVKNYRAACSGLVSANTVP